MTGTKFSALYCSQLYRKKKVKPWQDGFVVQDGLRVSLFDDRSTPIDTLYDHSAVLTEGDEIDFDRHFCTVEAPVQSNESCAVQVETPKKAPTTPRYATARLRVPPASLRKPLALTVTHRAQFSASPSAATTSERAVTPRSPLNGLQRNQVSPLTEGRNTIELEDAVSPPIARQRREAPREVLRRGLEDASLPSKTVPRSETPPKVVRRTADELLNLFGQSDDADADSEDEETQNADDAQTMGHTLELPSGRTNDLADQVELAGRLASPMIQRDKVVRRTSNELLDLFGGSEVEDPTPSSPTESPPQTGDRTLEPRNRQKRIFQVPESQSEETTQQGSKRLRTLDTENISPSNTEQTVVSRPAAEPGHTPTPIPIVSHEGLDRLFFPDMQACTELKGKGIHREIAIPVQFRSVQVYKDTFVKALTENLQVQLTTMAMNYHRLRAEKMTEDLTTFLRNRGIPFYANCQLSWYNAPFQRGLRRPKNLILALESKEHHSVYSRDDLWVVATSPDFSSTFIARSHFYGASRNTAIELCPMSPHDVKLADAMLRQTHVAWAIRVASASSEILMMANLRDNIGKTQLLPWMLSSASQNASGRTTFKPPSAAALVTAEAADKYNALVDEVADQFHLNQDQRAVLESFAGSILKPSGSPICLVHGVFGAGKSFLVSVIIIFLHRVREAGCLRKPDKFKVMVASMTNVAVDRILLELLHLNFTDFVRVGSLKKIAKPILPFTAQAKNDKDDAKDLHDMLNSELSVSEKKDVEDTIAKFKRNENKSIVESSFLVGATCLATTFESFDWYINTVVILDECSQMTEPMSLLPMARFGAQKALLIGDPLQLPPTLNTPSIATHKSGLDRTLFERMADSGHVPILLRTQYRCHPAIAAISNELFYKGQLKHGKTAADLPPLFDTFPTLCFVDVANGSETQRKGGTFVNNDEAQLVIRVARKLIDRGMLPSEIGIICLYKGQAGMIHDALRSDGVQVSTCDAFQGAEKTVILLCTVRTQYAGFIDEPRRVNVALTRAKRHLVIFGKRRLLAANELWGKILRNHCSGDRALAPADFMRLISTTM